MPRVLSASTRACGGERMSSVLFYALCDHGTRGMKRSMLYDGGSSVIILFKRVGISAAAVEDLIHENLYSSVEAD